MHRSSCGCSKHLLAKLLRISWRLAGPRAILQSRYSLGIKSPTPINYRIRPHIQTVGHRTDRLPLKTSPHDSRSFHQPGFHRSAVRPVFQNLTIFFRTFWHWRCFGQRHLLCPTTLRNITHLCVSTRCGLRDPEVGLSEAKRSKKSGWGPSDEDNIYPDFWRIESHFYGIPVFTPRGSARHFQLPPMLSCL